MSDILKKIYNKLPIIRELNQIRNSMHSLEVLESSLLFDIEFKNNSRYGNPKRLLMYHFRVNSQNGEDGILDEILKRVGTTNKIFVEIGVGPGVENNTAYLIARGWHGFWIDRNLAISKIRRRYKIPEDCLRGITTHVSRENIANIFSNLNVPIEFDVLSIDVDQNTYYIWEGLAKYKPRVVIVEYNSLLPPDVNWKVNYDPDRMWDGSGNFGASLKAFELLGDQLSYNLVGCDFFGVNSFFVRKDLVNDLFEAPFTAENHYEPSRLSVRFRNFPPSILDREPE